MDKVAILLVLYNDTHHLPRLVASIKKQTYKKFEIYAIETSESGESILLLKELYPQVKSFSYKGNLGYAGGNNFLAAKAIQMGADFLFVLNTDMLLDANCLNNLYNLIISDGNLGAVAPIVFHGKDNLKTLDIQCFAENIDFKTALTNPTFDMSLDIEDLPESVEVNILHGGAFLLSSVVYNKVGLFNEDLFMYGDERDLAYRIFNTQYKMMVSKKAMCWHFHDRSIFNKIAFRREYFYRVRNRLLFFHKNGRVFDLMKCIVKELVKIPGVYIWSIKRKDFKLFIYYYLGLYNGLIHRQGKSSYRFE